MQESYNGWRNYETWNVALWIQNDEGLHDFARANKRALHPYAHFAEDMKEMNFNETPDGVSWAYPDLDIEALDEMIGDL